jgi:hypothetical protein
MEVATMKGCFETHEFIHCRPVMKGPLKDELSAAISSEKKDFLRTKEFRK